MAQSHFASRPGDEIEFSDCLQSAIVGLVESADRFNPDHGVQFMTFAAYRMKGALIDGLERMTELHQQRAAARREEHPPEQLLSHGLEGTGMFRTGEPSENVPFYRKVEEQQFRDRMFGLVVKLPPQERKVVQGHYFQQRRFDEIAQAMGLTKGRISQIHSRALSRLRESLEAAP